MERTMSTNAKSKLRALAEQFRKNDEPELAEVFAAMARGEEVIPRLDELEYHQVFGMVGAMFVGFIAMQEEDDPSAHEFAALAAYMSLYYARRHHALHQRAKPVDPRMN
jgi:hypothetical protein